MDWNILLAIILGLMLTHWAAYMIGISKGHKEGHLLGKIEGAHRERIEACKRRPVGE